jgi:DNA-binding protein H-NS
MSDFLAILTHGRRLQSAVKELTVDELELVVEKLVTIIDKKKQEELDRQNQIAEKQQKLAAIKQQMEEAGLDISDFQELSTEKTKTKKTGKKRPVKYKIEHDGDIISWTGIGRMPVVFKNALNNGQSLDDFAI